MTEMYKQNMKAMFDPKSIAIYGASDNPIKVGGRPLRYLLEQRFAGEIYPINPKHTTAQGVRCYRSLAAIGHFVDLVIIAVPASGVCDVLRECAENRARSAVILSAGFAEVGEEGRRLQQKIQEVAKESGMCILGPNCLGMMNVNKRIPATFASVLERRDIPSGNIALISQSGAFGNHILGMAMDMQVGCSYWITTGNEADIQFNDCLEFAAEDEETDVITGYIEDVRDGRRFLAALDQCLDAEKPVIICKVGKTEAGSNAAASHTSAMAGEYQVYEAAFRQKGVIQAESLYAILDYASILSKRRDVRGNRVTVVTISGGAGVMLADKCEECDLQLAKLSDETKKKLREILPPFASVTNPVDITAQAVANPNLFADTLDVCLADEQTDAIIVYLGALDSIGKRIAERLSSVYAKTNKPFSVIWVSGPRDAIEILKANGVCVFDEPMRCVNALGRMIGYRLFVKNRNGARRKEELFSRFDVTTIRERLAKIAETRKTLSEQEARELLTYFGIPVVPGEKAMSAAEAVEVADRLGYPVVMKINSYAIPHKSDVGGVMLGLQSAKEVKEAFGVIVDRVRQVCGEAVPYDGVLVQRMEKDAVETIIGVKRDPVFGKVVAFGLGGVFTEVFHDVALQIAPIDREAALGMVDRIRSARILDGIRGRQPADKEAIANVLVRICELADALSTVVSEIEINPLFVFEHGVMAADALILLY